RNDPAQARASREARTAGEAVLTRSRRGSAHGGARRIGARAGGRARFGTASLVTTAPRGSSGEPVQAGAGGRAALRGSSATLGLAGSGMQPDSRRFDRSAQTL